jgi:hypothetical protein
VFDLYSYVDCWLVFCKLENKDAISVSHVPFDSANESSGVTVDPKQGQQYSIGHNMETIRLAISFHAGILPGLFDHDDGGDISLRNVV